MSGMTQRLAMASVVLVAAGCSSMKRPEIRQVRPRITAIDLQGVSLDFDVDVSNPYPVALRTPKFDYAVDVEETEFIRSHAPVEVDLPALHGGTVTLPARFGYTELWRTFSALKDAAEVKYRLRGTFMLSALGENVELPLSHTGTVPVLRLPAVSIDKVDVAELSLSSAKVMVDASLKNPNVFPLGMEQLGYVLRLGDVPVGSVSASTIESIAAGATGKLSLAGQITARSALTKLVSGSGLGQPSVSLAGAIQTPYGAVPVARTQ